jgi:hypothetical protein
MSRHRVRARLPPITRNYHQTARGDYERNPYVKDFLEVFSSLTIILGLPVAIMQFKYSAAKEQA